MNMYKEPLIKFMIFIGGAVVTSIIFVLLFNKIIEPQYKQKIDEAVERQRNIITQYENEVNEKNNENQIGSGEYENRCQPKKIEIPDVKEYYFVKPTADAWNKFASNKVGITFEYPVKKDTLVIFEYNDWPRQSTDPSGIYFSWEQKKEGEPTIMLANGSSRDIKVGRMSLEIYNWIEKDGKYYVNKANGGTIAVEKLEVYDTKFGTQALLYKNFCWAFCDNPNFKFDDTLKTLIVNLPAGHREGVESVLFRIEKDLTDSDISRIVNSLELVK